MNDVRRTAKAKPAKAVPLEIISLKNVFLDL